jgi:hypothetical protein
MIAKRANAIPPISASTCPASESKAKLPVVSTVIIDIAK